MDAVKKEIRKNCKKANSYKAWRNPFRVWFVTLFDENDMSFFEFQYSDDFPLRDRVWVGKLLEEIKNK